MTFGEWLIYQEEVFREDVPEEVRRRIHSVWPKIGNDPETLRIGASDEHDSVRGAVASNPMTPSDVLARFVDNNEFAVKVAHNSGASPELLSRLSLHSDEIIRATVAGNKTTSVVDLERMTSDLFEVVRLCVSRNHATPAWILDKLAEDPESSVRDQVARRSDNPGLLRKLAEDHDKRVRQSVAGNPRTLTVTLETLAADPVSFIRAFAVRNPNSNDLVKTIAVLAGGAGFGPD